MRVSVQGGGSSGVGPMRIIGRLLGSGAAGSSPETVSISRADDGGSGDESVPDVPEIVEEVQTVTEPAPHRPSPPPSSIQTDAPAGSSKLWLWVVLVVLVLLAALAAAWYFGLLKMPGLPHIGEFRGVCYRGRPGRS